MASDDCYTYPEQVRGASFSKADWKRAEKAKERMRQEAAKRCRQLVKDGKPLVSLDELALPEFRRDDAEQYEERLAAAEREAAGYEEP